MRAAALIAECNPLHRQHERLMGEIKARGFAALVVFLSGNYVQRGDVACFDKWQRTAALLSCGADLVIELPTCSVLCPAALYADHAVSLVAALGGIDTLFFGSESGKTETLLQMAQVLDSAAGRQAVRAELAKGKSYPRAVSEGLAPLLRTVGGTEAAEELLFSPNNILGLEYIRSGQAQRVSFDFQTIRRYPYPAGGAGATALRAALSAGDESLFATAVPEAAERIFKAAPLFDRRENEKGMLTFLRRLTRAEFAALGEVTDGLENALVRAAATATTLEEFYTQIKCKRYTHARLRRISFAAFLGIDRTLSAAAPPYLRVLGMNKTGEQLLHQCHPTLPLSGALKQLETENVLAARFAEKEILATELARFFTTAPLPAGREYTEPVRRS